MSDVSRRTFIGTTLAMTTLAAADYRIIDSHVHTWKHDPEFPFAQGANVPERDAAPETLLDLMKENGVSKTVIIQVIHYRYDNRFLAHRSEEHTSELQSLRHLVCRLLLEKKKKHRVPRVRVYRLSSGGGRGGIGRCH